MLVSSFVPDKDNFTYLRNNTFGSLLESLSFFSENPQSINDTNRFLLHRLVEDLNYKKPLFPYMLLNHSLVLNYERGNLTVLNDYISDFFEHSNGIFHKPCFVAYGDVAFSKRYWDVCESIITSTFDEQVYINAPEDERFNAIEKKITSALKEIKAISPIVYEEISNFVDGYLIINSNRFIAGSSFPLMSLVGLSDNLPIDKLIDLIVHENAHQYIYHLTVFDELCSGEGLYKSPLRKDPRPIEGIYHATYVVARLLYFYKCAQNKSASLHPDLIDSLIETYLKKFWDGYEVLKKHARLTSVGEELLESCRDYIYKNFYINKIYKKIS